MSSLSTKVHCSHYCYYHPTQIGSGKGHEMDIDSHLDLSCISSVCVVFVYIPIHRDGGEHCGLQLSPVWSEGMIPQLDCVA
jgi:hypothetical protein